MSGAGRGAPRVLLALGLVAGIACAAEPPDGSLTAVSWGGSFARAVNKAYYEPFEARTGVVIGREDYNGGLAQIRTQVDIGNVHWDVLSLEMSDAIRGCDEGLLERIPKDILAPGADGVPAEEDFSPGTLSECGVGHTFYSTIYAYHPDRFPDEKPSTIADFFDLERFPGRRGMRRTPLVNLEFALLADGVPTREVYAVLDTPEGLRRAFRKLDTIRDHVVWWEAGAQPPQMLADAEVVMSTAYNGRIFNAQVLENQPFVIVWDGQVLAWGQMAIVAGSPNLDIALEYIRFITSPESLARLTGYIAYGPVRRSALPLVSTHVETGADMLPHLPTSPANLGNTLRSDFAWWTEHLDEMNERFSAWLARS
ncbi:MAG: ABC transporter substrate-binding protein [Acidobacteriota bacterium]|nr:ABC transporter substrate-binding protein [Gammaproteobacteria bacterium]MDE2971721.1 ABC transporter substrate-binding protein [Acidobacteriota bacterium]